MDTTGSELANAVKWRDSRNIDRAFQRTQKTEVGSMRVRGRQDLVLRGKDRN